MFLFVLAAAATICPFPTDQWTRMATKHDLPPEVIQVFGDIAEKGEPFQVGDALPSGPPRPLSRFVAAQGRGCDLILNYEHGGRGHSYPTARLRFQAGHWVMVSRG